MKNTLEGINSRLNDTEESISKLEDRAVEITNAEQKKRKKNKKAFSYYVKGNRYQGPGSTKSPKQDQPKEDHSKTHCNKMAEIKDKEKILKAAGEKQQVTFKGTPIRLSSDFSAETLQARRE